MRTRKGGFWGRPSSRKKIKTRAWKAALAAAALGIGYAGYQRRHALNAGFQTGMDALQQRYAYRREPTPAERALEFAAQKQAAEEGLMLYDE